MYAHFLLFDQVKKDVRPLQKLAEQLTPLIKEQKGCQDVLFLLEEERKDYGILTLWNSKEEAASAYTIIASTLEYVEDTQTHGSHCTVPSMFQLFQVI